MAQERLRLLRRRGIETVILAGADTHGIMRGKRVPIAELDRAAQQGIALCDVIWVLPVDEVEPVQPPPGHAGYFPRAGYPDMLAVPDLETARVVPWYDHTALLLCDFVAHDDANSYLAVSAALAAGLDGVEREREPAPPVDGDVYASANGAARPLPATLGDEAVEHCVAIRRSELAAEAAVLTDWETYRYLEAL